MRKHVKVCEHILGLLWASKQEQVVICIRDDLLNDKQDVDDTKRNARYKKACNPLCILLRGNLSLMERSRKGKLIHY